MISLVEQLEPVPGPHEVLIRVDAVSLNFRDLAIARGAYWSPLGKVVIAEEVRS